MPHSVPNQSNRSTQCTTLFSGLTISAAGCGIAASPDFFHSLTRCCAFPLWVYDICTLFSISGPQQPCPFSSRLFYLCTYALIRFSGMDIDATCVKMSSISTMIYGLNGYALKLEAAAAEALAARQQHTNEKTHSDLQSPAQILRNVYRNGAAPPSAEEEASFEQIFRIAAGATVPAGWSG